MNAARLAAAGALALAALAAAGCGGTGSSPAAAPSPAAPSPAVPAAANPGGSDCLLGASGENVEVGIGSPSQSCGQWTQDLAGTGLNWYALTAMAVPGSQAADGSAYQVACDLTSGGTELYVVDTGSMEYGNNICSGEEQNGWVPEGSPGPLASQGQQDEQQQAQASASASAASASASASQAAAAADSGLKNDTATAWKDYRQWSADVGTVSAAYQKVKREPLCQGGTSDQTTYDDAQGVYDDAQAIYDDEGALSNDVSALQGDISALAGSGKYAGDIAAAKTALGKAQGAVNANESGTIQQEAGDIQTATGGCT